MMREIKIQKRVTVESVCGCMSLHLSPVMKWQLIQGVTCLPSDVSRDRLQDKRSYIMNE